MSIIDGLFGSGSSAPAKESEQAVLPEEKAAASASSATEKSVDTTTKTAKDAEKSSEFGKVLAEQESGQVKPQDQKKALDAKNAAAQTKDGAEKKALSPKALENRAKIDDIKAQMQKNGKPAVAKEVVERKNAKPDVQKQILDKLADMPNAIAKGVGEVMAKQKAEAEQEAEVMAAYTAGLTDGQMSAQSAMQSGMLVAMQAPHALRGMGVMPSALPMMNQNLQAPVMMPVGGTMDIMTPMMMGQPVLQNPMMQQPSVVPVMVPVAVEVLDVSHDDALQVNDTAGRMWNAPIVTSQEFISGREAVKKSALRGQHEVVRDVRPGSVVFGMNIPHLDAVREEESKDSALAALDSGLIGLRQPDSALKSDAVVSMPQAKQPISVASSADVGAQIWGLAQRGGGQVKVRIAPDHLGELTISVKNTRGKLDVKMETSSVEARDILNQSLPELKASLGASGRYNVNNVEVATSSTIASNVVGMRDSGMMDWGQSSNRGSQQDNSGSRSDQQAGRQFASSDQFLNQHQGRREGGRSKMLDMYYAQA